MEFEFVEDLFEFIENLEDQSILKIEDRDLLFETIEEKFIDKEQFEKTQNYSVITIKKEDPNEIDD